MATIALQSATETGTAVTFTAADAGGDQFRNNNDRGRVVYYVKNDDASPMTVTITAQDTSTAISGFGTVTKANGGGSVANGTEEVFGPFDEAFEDSNGNVQITYSSVTSVTVAAIKLPRLTGK